MAGGGIRRGAATLAVEHEETIMRGDLNYMRDARANILAISAEARPYLLAEHLAHRRDMRRRAQKAGDLQAELLAAKDEAKLLGLYPTDEQTGLHDTPIATVVSIYGHPGREEGDGGRPPRLSN